MSSETTIVAAQYRLQEWAAQDVYKRQESLSCCSPGESRSAASRSCEGRTFKPRWTGGGTGSNHHPQWMFDPCDRNHSYGPPFKRDRGDTECSMTPPALRRSTSSAATPICAPVWTVWLH